MAFDEQGFRKAAAAAGYSADEIESHIATEKKSVQPELPTSNTYEDFTKNEIAQQPSAAKRLEDKAQQTNPAIPYLAAAGAGAVGTAAAISAGKKIYNSLTDKMAADVQAKQAENTRIEPQLNISNKPTAGEPIFDVPNYAQTPAPVEAQTKPTVDQLKQNRKVTPKGVPEGMTELVGGGPGDRWLANEHPQLRKAIITQFNEGKPAGSYENAQQLYKQFKAYQAENIAGPAIPKEVAKERGMPPPKNYGAWGTMFLKGAGVTGLALTAAEMAQAAEAARRGSYGPARETGFNLLGMIPGVGTAFNTLTYAKGAGETPEELEKLQYMQKVGAGRGIAPPSR